LEISAGHVPRTSNFNDAHQESLNKFNEIQLAETQAYRKKSFDRQARL
jgi:hypothetical protein